MNRQLPTLLSRRAWIFAAGMSTCALLRRPSWLIAAESSGAEPQPYFAALNRILESVARLGAPVAPEDARQLAILSRQNDHAAVAAADAILSRYTLLNVSVGSDGVLTTSPGSAQCQLIEQGWRVFLLRFSNPLSWKGSVNLVTTGSSGVREIFVGMTPGHISYDPGPVSTWDQRAFLFDTTEKAPAIASLWLMSRLEDSSALSGLGIEYRVIELFSRDHGRRRADFFVEGESFVHQELEFNCLPSRDVVLEVLDSDGRTCIASFIIKDKLGRVYPPQAMRLAPDMAFQPQVYRAFGERVRLPDGEYRVQSTRGPEYLPVVQTVKVGNGLERIQGRLTRWIDPARWGWYSGDTHIHAAGCSHYASPTEGVSPETMIRHIRGEGLSIGDVLSWGPGWYYQKQFFKARAESPAAALEHPALQVANNTSFKPQTSAEDAESTLHYDVEVSGFPSSHAGHLVLLRLREQDFPGTKMIEDWPSWNLPILRWARSQGAVGGYAHSGLGLMVDSDHLPNYIIPRMDSIGAQEAIIDVTHGLVDFLGGCNTDVVAELNVWYHLLNCGFRMVFVGETDYPCVSGERPGMGRSYVRLDRRPIGDGGYRAWISGLKDGRVYSGDGRSHVLDFRVRHLRSGDPDLVLERPEILEVKATVAAMLDAVVTPELRAIQHAHGPYGSGWHLERARIGDTRDVAVQLIVNGEVTDQHQLTADGMPRSIRFSTQVTRSSWIALRILPSVHTYPVFIQVGKSPIRASRRSAQWCRSCVDKVWQVKSPFIRAVERAAARSAFDHARAIYDSIVVQCDVA